MRTLIDTLIIMLLLISLSGCTQKKDESVNLPAESTTIPVVTVSDDNAAQSKTHPDDEAKQITDNSDDVERNKAYGEILWNVFYQGQIEGTELAFPDADGNESGGFAIYDIDGDESDELLLYFDGGTTASNVEYIWGYENGTTHVELDSYPLLTFYNNGIIEEGWSHNQGLAGDFWPYFVYKYHSDSDKYQMYGGVDAWDKTLTSTNEKGEKFPTDIDADGDGIVYYLLPADWDGYYNMTPVDGKDYENWKNSYLKQSEEITDITYIGLCEGSIAELGAPKPEIDFPEPLG